MAGRTPIDYDSLQPLTRELDEIKRRLRELETPTGTQKASLLNQVQTQLASIDQRVTDSVAANSYTRAQIDSKVANPGDINPGNVNASGGVSSPGTVRGDAGLTSVGAYNLNVTTLPGDRRTAWIHASGALGQTVSSRRFKTSIVRVPSTAAQFLQVMPALFEYIGQVDIRDNPENPNYDPAYVVPVEVGVIAEQLVEAGLSEYVFFEDDGTTPLGVNYAEFGVHAALVIGADHEDRIAALEARLAQ